MNALNHVWSAVLLAGLAGLNGWAYSSFRAADAPAARGEPAGLAELLKKADDAVAGEKYDAAMAALGEANRVWPCAEVDARAEVVRDRLREIEAKKPRPVDPPTPPVIPPVVPSDPDAPRRFAAHVASGRAKAKERKYIGAVGDYRLAIEIKADDVVAGEIREAEAVISRGAAERAEGEKAAKREDYESALAFLTRATDLVADDEAAERLRREVVAKSTLTGSVLVLVLNTKSSRLGKDDFDKRLAEVVRENKAALLGGTVYVRTPDGVAPFAKGTKPASRFADEKAADAFAKAFATVKEFTARAKNPAFRTVILLDTDTDPTGDVVPPDGRGVWLVYGFNDGADKDSAKAAGWFGADKVARYKDTVSVAEFVKFFVAEAGK